MKKEKTNLECVLKKWSTESNKIDYKNLVKVYNKLKSAIADFDWELLHGFPCPVIFTPIGAEKIKERIWQEYLDMNYKYFEKLAKQLKKDSKEVDKMRLE